MIRVSDSPIESSEFTVWNGFEPTHSIFGRDFIDQWFELQDGDEVVRFDAGGVLIAGQASVDFAMHHPEVFSSGPEAFYLGSEDGLIPIQKDPPEHTKYRKLLDRSFAHQQISWLEDSIVEHTSRCIDTILSKGTADFVAELAVPVPSLTILMMFGFPAERLEEFMQVKNDILRPDPSLAADELKAHTAKAGATAFAFFSSVLDERLSDPRDDLASHLASLEGAGRLTRAESLDICLMMLIAGLDTVSTTLTNMVLLLAENVELRQEIVKDPAVIPAAVEELLRVIVPVPNTPRVVLEDVELGGCPLRKGERVTVLLPISNFDPAVFHEPRKVDFSRLSNRHASFGIGRHRCLGSHLARLELQVVLREWHQRVPSYHVPEGHKVEWNRGIREISALPITVG